MWGSIAHTRLISAAPDAGQSWKVAGQYYFLQCDSNRLCHWNGVLRVISCDYSLKSQSILAPKETVFIHHDWPTAVVAPWRLPRSLSVYTGLDRFGLCSPGGLSWKTWMTLAAGTRAVSFHRGTLGAKAPLVITCGFSIAFQSCGKERTARDRCQTNLLQLTCAATVEPSDPDLDGNHCKYFSARLVEDSFNRASHWGIKLTVNYSKCLHFVSSVPKQ